LVTKAVAQHQRLVDTLKKHDPEATVKHHNILLGVGGAIYTDMINTMKDELGVTGRSLDTLLRKLHYTAVEEVGNMWKHRRAKLHNKLGAKKARTTGFKRPDKNHHWQKAPPHRKTKKQKT
jgi:hypothetical protein